MKTLKEHIVKSCNFLKRGAKWAGRIAKGKSREVMTCAIVAVASMMLGLVLGVVVRGDLRAVGAELANSTDVGFSNGDIGVYLLKIDGGLVGAAEDETELLNVLESILEEYSTETTALIRFIDDILVTKGYICEIVAGEIVTDTDELFEILAPSNEDSEWRLAIESVESALLSEEIPFEREYVEDDTLYKGDIRIIEEGRPGIVLFAETIVRLNGIEQSRDRAAEIHATYPVTERVLIGTMPRTSSQGNYIWPANGSVSSGFGFRTIAVGSSNHRGIDIRGNLGDPIFAADGGEVIFAGWNSGGFGNMVRILHDNGEETLYAHCSEILVSIGERVYQGQIIARMGSTGTSTGVHLHFEIIINGVQIDPIRRLPSR